MPKLPLPGILAAAALAGYGIFVWVMWRELDSESVRWERLVYLLAGVEAIAFAAVGWVFGREVRRGEADQAMIRAGLAEDQAKMLAAGVLEARKGLPKGQLTPDQGRALVERLDVLAAQARVVAAD